MLLTFVALSTACIPRGVTVGGLGMRAQQGKPRGTSQPCLEAPISVCLAEAAVTAAALRIGHLAPASASGVGICLIEQPEPCCQGGWCVGPMGPGGVTARKAGCSGSYLIVAARMWPPVCTNAWGDEPHCVATAAAQVDLGYSMLIHEAVKWTLDRYSLVGDGEVLLARVDEVKVQAEALKACGAGK